MKPFEIDPSAQSESAVSSAAVPQRQEVSGDVLRRRSSSGRGPLIDWHSKMSSGRFIQMARRAGTGLRAGVDIRRVCELEASRGSAKDQQVMGEISRQINSGNSFAEAVRDSRYFAPLVVELVKVGEQTGKLDEVFFQLADHYEQLRKLLRNFLLGIAWPMFEFGMALLVIALVIWAPTALTGQKQDLLGIGLTGSSGVMWYFLIVGCTIAFAAACIWALVRGLFGPAPIEVARRLPILGRCLECLALARCSWVLALAHESGMSARKTARLALAASHHPLFKGKARQVDEVLAQSRPFHEAFNEAGVFPVDFLDAIHTSELSGTLTETMTRKYHDYEEESTTLLQRLTVIAGTIVFLMVVGFMVFMIFSLAMNYINTIQGFIDNPMGNP